MSLDSPTFNLQGCIINTLQIIFFFQAEDGIRDCLLSRGLGDVYKRQLLGSFVGVLLGGQNP